MMRYELVSLVSDENVRMQIIQILGKIAPDIESKMEEAVSLLELRKIWSARKDILLFVKNRLGIKERMDDPAHVVRLRYRCHDTCCGRQDEGANPTQTKKN